MGYCSTIAVFALLVLASVANASQTITANFENYAAGDNFKPSFTDPVSGIHFRNSTNPTGGFVIDDSDHFFGGGNYLTAAIGPTDGFGSYFGFTADLPQPADNVALDVIYGADSRSNVVLQGFNSSGVVVAQEAGPSGYSPDSFHLQISDGQFDITTFKVSVGGGATGYDNISYTVLPEPTSLFFGLGMLELLSIRRR